VDLVVDLDLFVRSIRGDVIAGAHDEAGARAKIDADWEGDLLRRVRRVRFGHPDPDVRDAADGVDNAMWIYIIAAGLKLDPPAPLPDYSVEERRVISFEMEAALKELRRAVYLAPNRDVPAMIRFDGSNYPSRLSRALEQEETDG
jgi:hypothetical protein